MICCSRLTKVSSCYIFPSLTVVNKVIAKSHILNGALLELRRHNPVLPKSACVTEDRVQEKEIPVDMQVMQFICERHEADLEHIQRKHGVEVKWEEG